MKNDEFELSIVIPVYNSENTLKILVNSLMDELKNKLKYEIIFVNDCSCDSSNKVLLELFKIHDNIKVLELSKNFGQHNAVMAGLNHVKGQYVLCMDDDLQTHPSEIFKLYNELINKKFDVVFAKYNDYLHKGYRGFGSKVNSLMAEILLNKPKELYISSFFIMRKYVVDEIIKYTGAYSYLQGLILRITKNIGNVDVEHRERISGSSNYNIRKLLSLWLNGFTGFSIKPLRLITYTGFIFALFSFMYMILVFIKGIIYNVAPVGWTTLVILTLLLGGINLIALGLIGEYLGRSFLLLNSTPQFIVKEKYIKGE